MSIEQVSRVLNHPGVKGTEKLVLIGIANHDGDGGSWPTLDTLARYAGVDRRSVRRSLRSLEDQGLIRVEYNAGGTIHTQENRRPNRYILTLQSGGTREPSESGRGDTEDALGGHAEPPGGTETPPRGGSNVPQTILEPSLEPSLLEPMASVTPIDHFASFWKAYPSKIGQKPARLQWAKATKHATPEYIINAARAYRDDPNREDQYTRRAANWLRDEGWTDPPLPARNLTQSISPREQQQIRALSISDRYREQERLQEQQPAKEITCEVI